jgi:hypothetical protein
VAEIKITADTAQAERKIKDLDKALDSLGSQAGDAAKALAVITGAAAAMAFVINRTINAAGELVDAANAIGVSASNLKTLQTAAQLAGVGTDQLNNTLIRLNQTIGQAVSDGIGPGADALKKLGLPINEIVRMRPDEQFKKITETLNGMSNPAERTALAMDLFGKQGPRILAVASELEKVRKITKDIGFGISEKEIVALDEASDQVDQLRIIWDSGVKKAVAEIAPYIVGIAISIKEAIKEAGGFEGIWNKIRSVLNVILNIMLGIATILAVRMVAGAYLFTVQLGKALLAAKGIATVLARTPIGLLAAGAAILADKIGIDLVGGLGEAAGLTHIQAKGQEHINSAVEERNNMLNQEREITKQISQAQDKALKSLDASINSLQRQRDQSIELLSLSQAEVSANQKIREEREKLLKVGSDLTADQEKKIALLILENDIAKGIFETRSKISELENQKAVAGGANSELLRIQKEIEAVVARRQSAESSGNQQLILEAQQQEAQYKALYADRVMFLAKTSTEIGKIEYDAFLRLQQLKYLEQEMIKTNGSIDIDLAKQIADEKLKIEQELNDKKQQLSLDRIRREMMAQKDLAKYSLSTMDKELLQKQGQQEKQQEAVNARTEFEKKSEFDKTQFGIQQAGLLFSALGAQNKKAFEAAKAFNIANAIMNTYAAATKALATYPFPFGAIAAAAAVAAGLAQVAQIRAQTYSGRALGGPVMGNQSYVVGERGPELFTPTTNGRVTRNQDMGNGGGVTNVNFTIVANDTTGFDQLLASRKGVIQQIISDAMLEKGKRSFA